VGPRAKISTRRCAAAAIAVTFAAAALPGSVAGSAASDLDAIVKDYRADSDVTPCLFTKKQLENAKGLLTADFNTYEPQFKAELNREIKRWTDGGCSGGTGGGGSASSGLQIVKAKGKGAARKESVTLKNSGKKTVNLRGYALRNKAHKKLRLTTFSLRKGKTVRVITGCARGKHKSSSTSSRYYACRSKQFWSDSGDVVELLNKTGTVAARRPTT
jgi:hypothetical protein